MSGKQCSSTQWHSRVRGEPSDEELAALIVVLATLPGAAAAGPPAPRSSWADPAHRLRAPLHPAPGVWRSSARPPWAHPVNL
ncbi:MAG TPA: acyl-CoA carboxylase subunit epsilon [Pseudonocardiaceae bacterium]